MQLLGCGGELESNGCCVMLLGTQIVLPCFASYGDAPWRRWAMSNHIMSPLWAGLHKSGRRAMSDCILSLRNTCDTPPASTISNRLAPEPGSLPESCSEPAQHLFGQRSHSFQLLGKKSYAVPPWPWKPLKDTLKSCQALTELPVALKGDSIFPIPTSAQESCKKRPALAIGATPSSLSLSLCWGCVA